MSTEFEISALTHPSAPEPSSHALVHKFDRVLHTADDRPNTATLPQLVDPAADHPAADDPDGHRADVEAKHRLVVQFLDAHGLDGVVLTRADSIAWFTCGGELQRGLYGEHAAAMLYLNRSSRAVVCDNVQTARVFEEEVAGLGFQLKERPWHEDLDRTLAELCHSRKVASDAPRVGAVPELAPALRRLRYTLTPIERQRLRVLGRTVTLAVEATCRNFTPGENEADVAGHLAHRLIREGVVPADIRVAGDDRLDRFRQPTFKAAPIRRRAIISVVGRRHGLCAGVTRTVSFGPSSAEEIQAHQVTSMVDATCIFFSRPGERVSDVFRRARRIYEKFGHADEWQLAYQGHLTGYSPCEECLRPDSGWPLEANMALRWHPSVGSCRCEDTVVIDGRGYEVVTQAQDWPEVEITVKGFPMSRPGILERPVGG